jgi:L-ascorbate metabolism protein UlaG (beta-lactamase superfamily)
MVAPSHTGTMEITWLGRNCFRIRGREGAVVTDPCPPDSGYKFAKPAADIVTFSSKDDPGYSAIDVVGGTPKVLDAPGEYEIGGILVTGVATKGPNDTRNVAFVVEVDGIRVGHLGLLTSAPTAGQIEALGDIDVLLLPAGGGNALSPKLAQDLMTKFDPHVAIPMNYRTEVESLDLEPLENFLKETGAKPEAQARIQVTKNTLPEDLTVMVLEPRS